MLIKSNHRILTLLLLLLVCTEILSCNSDRPSSEEEVRAKASIRKISTTVTQIQAVNAAKLPFDYRISSNGKVRSANEQKVISTVNSQVSWSAALNNKAVSTGTLLIKLENFELIQKLKRSELSWFNARKEYQSQLLGYENLLRQVASKEADTIKKKLRISTGLSVAEQDILEQKYELNKTLIKAPFSGILADVKIQSGQQIKPGDELFRIYNPTKLFLEINIMESDLPLVRTGMRAKVWPLASTENKYDAVIEEVNPYVNDNGLVNVKLQIIQKKSNKRNLFPGMNCQAIIDVPLRKTLVIPKEAVLIRAGRPVVFTTEHGVAKWNYVQTGRDNGRQIEILDGLITGDRIITKNNSQLSHGSPVVEQ